MSERPYGPSGFPVPRSHDLLELFKAATAVVGTAGASFLVAVLNSIALEVPEVRAFSAFLQPVLYVLLAVILLVLVSRAAANLRQYGRRPDRILDVIGPGTPPGHSTISSPADSVPSLSLGLFPVGPSATRLLQVLTKLEFQLHRITIDITALDAVAANMANVSAGSTNPSALAHTGDDARFANYPAAELLHHNLLVAAGPARYRLHPDAMNLGPDTEEDAWVEAGVAWLLRHYADIAEAQSIALGSPTHATNAHLWFEAEHQLLALLAKAAGTKSQQPRLLLEDQLCISEALFVWYDSRQMHHFSEQLAEDIKQVTDRVAPTEAPRKSRWAKASQLRPASRRRARLLQWFSGLPDRLLTRARQLLRWFGKLPDRVRNFWDAFTDWLEPYEDLRLNSVIRLRSTTRRQNGRNQVVDELEESDTWKRYAWKPEEWRTNVWKVRSRSLRPAFRTRYHHIRALEFADEQNYNSAEKELLHAWRRCPRDDHQTATAILLNLAIVHLHQGRLWPAQDRLELADSLAFTNRDGRKWAHAIELMGIVSWAGGRWPQAVIHWHRAEKGYHRVGDDIGMRRCQRFLLDAREREHVLTDVSPTAALRSDQERWDEPPRRGWLSELLRWRPVR